LICAMPIMFRIYLKQQQDPSCLQTLMQGNAFARRCNNHLQLSAQRGQQ
jgi:hypothetical protein